MMTQEIIATIDSIQYCHRVNCGYDICQFIHWQLGSIYLTLNLQLTKLYFSNSVSDNIIYINIEEALTYLSPAHKQSLLFHLDLFT